MLLRCHCSWGQRSCYLQNAFSQFIIGSILNTRSLESKFYTVFGPKIVPCLCFKFLFVLLGVVLILGCVKRIHYSKGYFLNTERKDF